MTKKELLDYLKENLRIQFTTEMCNANLRVTLYLEDEEISTDIVCIP